MLKDDRVDVKKIFRVFVDKTLINFLKNYYFFLYYDRILINNK